jgi:glucosamine--fructose-6-phosphate aminotransferase (isomerizing)
MTNGYVPFAQARREQSALLELAVPRVVEQVRALAAAGGLAGPGPVFVGIGASFAAAGAPVWALRSRGIHSWRLGAGDLPVPYPHSDHPIVGVSQSGRSAETLAVLESIPAEQRIVVVNTDPSPMAALGAPTVSLGNLDDSYASTIGYTATVAALGILADAWNDGPIDPGWMRLGETFAAVDEVARARAEALAPLFEYATSADFVGAGPAAGSAEAGALLFREVARIPATGMSTRQYLHGSMESAGNGVHIVLGDGRELDMAHTLSDAGHQVILLSAESVQETATLHPIAVPRSPAAQRAVLEAAVLQSLVQSVTAIRGLDIEEFVFHNADTKVPTGEEA